MRSIRMIEEFIYNFRDRSAQRPERGSGGGRPAGTPGHASRRPLLVVSGGVR
jgi:hypothetical protein